MAGAHVAVVRWPEEVELRTALRARRVPRLLLVRDGSSPPDDSDVLEDWASLSADAAELEARLATLEARAIASMNTETRLPAFEDGVVRFNGRWVALGDVEARIARVLIDHLGEVVSRSTIESETWHGRDVRANTTDRQMHRLRLHFRQLGLELHTLRGKGYVLEVPS
jgi:two-component system response regulator TctD